MKFTLLTGLLLFSACGEVSVTPVPSPVPFPIPNPSIGVSPTPSPSPSPSPSPIPSPIPSPSPVPILTGNYCTIEDFENVYSPSVPKAMSIVCLQPDGTWLAITPPSYPVTDDGGDYYDGATLTVDGIGNIFVTEKLEFDDLFMWSYSQAQGWQETPEVNSNTGSPCTALGGSSYVHTYFGPSMAIYNGMPTVLWDSQFICNSGDPGGNSRVWLSQWDGTAWTHTDLADPLGEENYAKIYISPATNLLYAYWASPSITIHRLNPDGSVYPFTLGNPDNDPNYPDNYFMSLTEWNGQLVMSFSESNGSLTQNQALTTAITQVAYYDGSIWHNLGAPIEDTPGNLEYDDYIFTYGGNLYVLYADFSTSGPGLAHMRIKQWNGTTWIRIGSESPIIAYGRRFEPLQDNAKLILGAIFASQSGTFWEHSVYSFDLTTGVWTQVGNAIKQCNAGGWNGCSSVFRPGAVVKIGE